MISDIIKTRIIGTKLGNLLETARVFFQLPKYLKHPELAGLLSEGIGQRKLFEQLIKRDFNCIDIGTHVGSVLSLFLEFAPEGQHLAVEADSEKIEFLREKFKDVKIFATALSDRDGEVFFKKEKKKTGFNRLVLESSEKESSSISKIPSTTLDSLVANEKIINFLKIDVELSLIHI